MKKLVLAASAVDCSVGLAHAQNLSVSGFLAFKAIYGENYDFDAVEYWV